MCVKECSILILVFDKSTPGLSHYSAWWRRLISYTLGIDSFDTPLLTHFLPSHTVKFFSFCIVPAFTVDSYWDTWPSLFAPGFLQESKIFDT